MQIYADVLQKEILVVDHNQIPALGAAILGAAAVNDKPNEKDALNSAIQKIGFKDYIQYSPNKKMKRSTTNYMAYIETLAIILAAMGIF